MEILMRVNFEVINLVEGIHAYPTLVRKPWAQNMKDIISL